MPAKISKVMIFLGNVKHLRKLSSYILVSSCTLYSFQSAQIVFLEGKAMYNANFISFFPLFLRSLFGRINIFC